MGNTVASGYYGKIGGNFDFGMCTPDSYYMEKLCEVMKNRILKKDTAEFDLVLKGTDMYDKGYVLDRDYYIDRYYAEFDGAFMDAFEAGADLLGTLSGFVRPFWPGESEPDATSEAFDFIGSHDPLEVAQKYLRFDMEVLKALPLFCEDLAETADMDPLFEEADMGFFLLESPFIGRYLSCDHIPDPMRKTALELLSRVRDPFDRGYWWDGVANGVYYGIILAGCPDGYEWISPLLLSANYLAAAACLKDEIEYQDSLFHFLDGAEEGV